MQEVESNVHLALRVESAVADLPEVYSAVEALGHQEGWSAELAFQIPLVIEEVVLNVVNHGRAAGDDLIEIFVTSDPQLVSVAISDGGRGFNPLTDGSGADLDASIEDRQVGGLGLHLVRTLMDELEYRRESGRNCLALVKRRSL